jgi:hypothetical protein
VGIGEAFGKVVFTATSEPVAVIEGKGLAGIEILSTGGA